MKRKHKILAALLSICMCLAPLPVTAAAGTSSLSEICAEADAARSDYRIRTLDFPTIDRSDMTDGYAYKMADNRYALKGWGVFHAEDYKITPNSRGPYFSATAIVNRRGDLIIPWQPTMSSFQYEVNFEDGVYSIVYPQGLHADYWKNNMPRNVSEYYDENGNVLFEHEPFAAAGPMQDGTAWVAYPSDGYDYPLVKLIDKTGAEIADLSDKKYGYINDFSEGLANYSYYDADGSMRYGYFDKTGKTVLETDNLCGDFHNGLAWVLIDKKYGFMDTSGNLVIPAEYTALGDSKGFTAESVLVKKGDYWALIDKTGQFLTDFIYTMSPERPIPAIEYAEDHVYDAGDYAFADGYTTVYRDGKYFLLDTKGKEVLTDPGKLLYPYGNGLFGVGNTEFSGAYDIIDSKGDSVLTQNMGTLHYCGNGVFRIVGSHPGMFFEVEPAATASIIPGDVSGDGITDIMDVILLNKHLLGVSELDASAKKAADLNGDGTVDSSDSLAVLKEALGIASDPEPEEKTINLSAAYAAQPVQTADIDEQTVLGQTKFALDLLRASAKSGENSLVSPFSVSQALGMTANGAAGDTLKEMETVLGGSMETLNPAFYSLRTRDTKDAKCVTANSIWVRNSFVQEHPVSKAFLQSNADYYGADAFAAPFDSTTLNDINHWVDEKTDHQIPAVLKEIHPNAVLYLVNAVTFDAEWEQPYKDAPERAFTAADGTKQMIPTLCRDGSMQYYQDAHAVGFRQDYKGEQYYFAAFLPEEGMTPEVYLDTLTAASLQKLLAKPETGHVYTELPAFSYDDSISLAEPLSAMGMPLAFTDGPESDFSRMVTDGGDDLYIRNVYHKTHIEVTRMGTRAGAATSVEMAVKSIPVYIRMNRPFLYMIADSETNLPVFIGIVNSVDSKLSTE